MKKFEVELTNNIRGPSNQDERHQAGEVLTVTAEEWGRINSHHAGRILQEVEVPDAPGMKERVLSSDATEVISSGSDSRRGEHLLHNTSGVDIMGGANTNTKSRSNRNRTG